jgi:hypothetical protein
MEGMELVRKLNEYPMYPDFDVRARSDAYHTVTELGDVYSHATPDARKLITSALGRPAQFLMYEYSKDKAVEGIRNRSRAAIVQGLMAVVVAGGRSDNPTGGSLLSMLLRSAEKSGLDAQEAFAYAAEFAADGESGTQIRAFPLLPSEMRSIERYGFHERKTPDGVVYEHMTEAMMRPRWWDKLTGRRRVTKEKALRMNREHERTRDSQKKSAT